VKFSQLRLSGFKSFVEPTELLIKDGLTGIVGPNGCGKSNLVEALRWVMGETSAKNMRGGAMDDVIFAGTASRAARNMAEVTLGLDNTDRGAPPAYNTTTELDITRRIRRDSGSDYRINGKVTRARDVQLLFADMATGAHSTAIVSQGRVGALINAKPKDRRHLLEEAAGISGLHSRRHEAELRLKAAEANLERVDDVTGQLEVQLSGLKRQARQATRYRNISGHIRKAEAMLLYRKYEQASATEKSAQHRYKEAAEAVTELTRQTALAQNASLKAAEALKPLREAEAAAAAQVHKLALLGENLAAEEERLKKAQQQLEDRKSQISSDMQREKNLEKDAAEAVRKLREECVRLEAESIEDEPKLDQLSTSIQTRQTSVRTLQGKLDAMTEAYASEKARHTARQQQLDTARHSLKRHQEKLATLTKEKLVLAADLKTLDQTNTLSQEIAAAVQKSVDLAEKLEKAEAESQAADGEERKAREALNISEKETAAIEAEIRALASLLVQDEGDWTPVAEHLTVKAGYETALGAALGDDLDASTNPAASAIWAERTPSTSLSSFPKHIKTLDVFVSGESALTARLSQIAVVDTIEEGEKLKNALECGQRLVTLDGALWRWDGFHQKPDVKSVASVRLEQRNRKTELEKQLKKQHLQESELKEALSLAEKTLLDKRKDETHIRDSRRATEKELSALRANQASQQRAEATKRSRLQSVEEQEAAALSDSAEVRAHIEQLESELSNLPDLSQSHVTLDKLKAQLREQRDESGRIRADHDKLVRTAAIRQDRIRSANAERENWIKRSSNMADHFSQLEIRFSTTDQEIKELENKPKEIMARRGELSDEMARAESARTTVRAQVTEAESVLAQCDAALQQAQNALATCREERVRYQADVEHSAELLKNLADQISEKLDCTPENIKSAGDIADNEEIPPIDVSEKKLGRLKRERDGMGPVNLRAEIEAQEVDEQLTTLVTERADLEAAISRLRQGISSLNKEGRERLLVAFKKVDSHFQELFKQVFGGGHAHLALTESDDPLAAGLEIMASPPGKRLQLMSLLSGGEQALTAVALLFAVFLTNPAPICVLDEVDAPLDDVNVERLCNLLDRLSADSDTRFLVVTHHPITMARMDRLFGVTMAERGISQLVSVDLTRAQLMTEAAL